jgi:uncharacterized membrane protein
MMDFLAGFFGRFHPLLVHLPIGILFLAFAFECLGSLRRYKKLKKAVQPSLLIGAAFAVLAAITGYLLSMEGGYEDELLAWHQVLGIITACVTIALYFLRKSNYVNNKPKPVKNTIRLISFSILMVLLSITGHFGGSLTHGEEYLFSFQPADDSSQPVIAATLKDDAIVYNEVIQPILKSKCYSCHSAQKQKGQLRLDGVEFIARGGKHGEVISGTIADSSSLYKRLMLPLEDELHMPPNEKPQLSSAEISLIQVWLEEGARFNTPLKQYTQAGRIKQYISMLQVAPTDKASLLPQKEINAADAATVETLRRQNVIVLPVSQESNYLSANFLNVKSITEEQIDATVKLKDHVVSVMLARTAITDNQFSEFKKLEQLRSIDLRHTNISDGSLETLKQFKELRMLNLMNTQVSDEGIKALADLDELQHIFLYQTKVTSAGVTWLKSKLPKLEIDTGGYQLQTLSTDTVVLKRKI